MNHHLRLLQQLARYKYLSVWQWYMLWYAYSTKTLYKKLKLLEEKNLIGKKCYKYHPQRGRSENIYHLTTQGAEYLIIHTKKPLQGMHITKHPKLLSNDYDHRKKTITAHILMDLACDNLSLSRYRYYHYFQKRKKQQGFPQTATKLKVWDDIIIPDSIALLSPTQAKKQKSLLIIEIHKGQRVKKILEQLKPYAKIIASGVAWTEFGVATNPYVLVLFEHESTLLSTLEIMSQDSYYTNLKDHFLFKTFESLQKDCLSHRLNLRKEKVHLLPNNNSNTNTDSPDEKE